jgi:hypothetical protein
MLESILEEDLTLRSLEKCGIFVDDVDEFQ